MGKGPINENNNVYFKARKNAVVYNEKLYSREGAAELLGISVSTLADYELGNTKVVPVDKVILMAEMCNDSQKRQGISKVSGNRQYALVQIWYRMEKKHLSALRLPRLPGKRPILQIGQHGESPALCPARMTISAFSRHSLPFPRSTT